MLGPTQVLMASHNLLEGTLPNLVNLDLKALYLSGAAGRSGGSMWDLPKGHWVEVFKERQGQKKHPRELLPSGVQKAW